MWKTGRLLEEEPEVNEIACQLMFRRNCVRSGPMHTNVQEEQHKPTNSESQVINGLVPPEDR